MNVLSAGLVFENRLGRPSQIRYRNTCRAASLSQDLCDLIPQFDAQVLVSRADEDSTEQRVVHLLPRIRRCSEISRVHAAEEIQNFRYASYRRIRIFPEPGSFFAGLRQRLRQLPLLSYERLAGDTV